MKSKPDVATEDKARETHKGAKKARTRPSAMLATASGINTNSWPSKRICHMRQGLSGNWRYKQTLKRPIKTNAGVASAKLQGDRRTLGRMDCISSAFLLRPQTVVLRLLAVLPTEGRRCAHTTQRVHFRENVLGEKAADGSQWLWRCLA